jgi:nucleoid-associated protein YgaU
MPDIHEKGSDAKGQKKQKQTETERVMGELKAARAALNRKKEAEPAAKTVKAPKTIAKHKVVSGDTMSGLALKYYGSAVREKWMYIYEANKETIGDNPAFIKVGQVLNSPELPK